MMIILTFDGQAHPDRRRQRDDPESLRHDVRGRGRRHGVRRPGPPTRGWRWRSGTHPDLIIADGVMPGRSGYDLCAPIGRPGAARGPGAHPGVQPAALRRRARVRARARTASCSKPWDTDRVHGQGPRAAARGRRSAQALPRPLPPPARTRAASMPASAIDDDDYGEISIDPPARRRALHDHATAAPPAVGAPHRARMPASSPRRASAASAARLVPGDAAVSHPGHAPRRHAARRGPGRCRSARCAGPPDADAAGLPPRPAAPPVGRTMIGLPAANIPDPGGACARAPSMPPMAPLAPADAVSDRADRAAGRRRAMPLASRARGR